jgi:phosphate transport system substrate-binding protein
MSQQKPKRRIWLTWTGGSVAIAIALLWSIGLVSGGLWKLTQRWEKPTEQTKSTVLKGFAQVPNVPTGLFSYSGSPAWAPIRLSIDSTIQAERPEFRLRYIQPREKPPSSREAIEMLLDKRLTFVQSSDPLQQTDRDRAAQGNFRLKQVPVAIDSIVVVVNPSLDISGLTLEQLRSIYRGQITNWKALGGPNLKITPYSPPVNANSKLELFVENILRGQAFGSNVEVVTTSTEALRKLANNPSGIFYGYAPSIIPQCGVKPLALGRSPGEFINPYQGALVPSSDCPNRRNKINLEAIQSGKYPLTLYLYVVVKQNNDTEERAGEAYANFLLTEQGQQLLEQAGYVRIR